MWLRSQQIGGECVMQQSSLLGVQPAGQKATSHPSWLILHLYFSPGMPPTSMWKSPAHDSIHNSALSIFRCLGSGETWPWGWTDLLEKARQDSSSSDVRNLLGVSSAGPCRTAPVWSRVGPSWQVNTDPYPTRKDLSVYDSDVSARTKIRVSFP